MKDLGYVAHDWGLGRNLKFNPEVEGKMLALLEQTYRDSGQKVSLVGWSLGGVFAREIAKSNPDYVRNVVTLGSPITGARHETCKLAYPSACTLHINLFKNRRCGSLAWVCSR